MPDTGEIYDLLAWFKLRDLYREFRAGRIDRAEGESRKQSIFRKRNDDASRSQMHLSAQKRIAEFFRTIEVASSAYMKDRTIENADALIETIYGRGIIKSKNQTNRKDDANAETQNDNGGGSE